MNNVTVIIPTYNSSAVIVSCLRSVPAGVRVIVVDNNSTDSTVIIAQQSGVEVVINSNNIGFGRACNIGIQKSETPFSLLLNPDAILNDSVLHVMMGAMAKYQDAGIIVPVLHFENGDYQNSFRANIFARKTVAATSRKLMKSIVPEGDLCADFVSGACMLLRMSAIEKIGAFDENIFMFYEDDDLCMRMRLGGYSCIMAGEARIIHVRGASSAYSADSERIKNYHISRSRVYMQLKYKGRAAMRCLIVQLIVKHLFKAIIAVITFNGKKTMREFNRARGAVSSRAFSI